MKIKNLINLALLASVIMFTAPSCVKEGPMGLQGEAGADGAAGTNAGETCAMCHKKDVVDLISTQFQLSKHHYGEAAFEEAGNTSCTPCHAQEAFKYVVKNNVSAKFQLNTTTNRYVNQYATAATHAYGEIGCATCHSELHTTYGTEDLKFTTTAPVEMTMWGGNKTIDLKADGGVSNMCVKCHQPRPFTDATVAGQGNVLNYADLAANPTAVIFDGTLDTPNTTDKIRPSYRTHTHYGTAGAIYAGTGGVEFPGSLPYTSSAHKDVASCVDCHMGEMNGRAGGHTFTAKGNLTTCNTAGCHSTPVTATTANLWVNPRNEIKTLLNALAAKLVIASTINGVPVTVDILNRSADAEHNLWYGLTTNNYDGYLNIFDPITNPSARTYNASSFRFVGTPPATWSQADKDYNATLPVITLTNAQMGALINFQLCLRDYSLGIHNYAYTKALLTNSIAILP